VAGDLRLVVQAEVEIQREVEDQSLGVAAVEIESVDLGVSPPAVDLGHLVDILSDRDTQQRDAGHHALDFGLVDQVSHGFLSARDDSKHPPEPFVESRAMRLRSAALRM
jgi:hypothetical protein